jgi:transposase
MAKTMLCQAGPTRPPSALPAENLAHELPAETRHSNALASFANGLRADQAALTAALREPWSNGQTEGQINRLKMLERTMYGRANLDLLKARLIAVV